MAIIFFALSWFYGIFAFSQIIIPIIRGIPRAINKKKEVRIIQMFISIAIWSTVTYFLYEFITGKYIKHENPINIGLIISAFMILFKSFRGGADLESDIYDSYGL